MAVLERLVAVVFGPSRSKRFAKAVELAQAGPGGCREIEPGRYRVSFRLGDDPAVYKRFGWLVERVRHWRATEVYDEQGTSAGNGFPGDASRATGGMGGGSVAPPQEAGSTPTPSNARSMVSTVLSWPRAGLARFTAGACGGQGQNRQTTGAPGSPGSNGIYIQANRIISGTINAAGTDGQYSGSAGSSGGGGGGTIVLVYGPGGLVPGAYNVRGGAASVNSGAGGAGNILMIPTVG